VIRKTGTIPIIINNRNLLTWPKAMIDRIKLLKNVGEIIIVDNASTYKPLLAWYETLPYKIIRTKNIGHTAPWKVGAITSIPYVVTDPDLGINDLPLDTLLVLEKKLDDYFSLGKIGLDLDWKRVTKKSPWYDHMQNYERERRKNSKTVDGVQVDVNIDTTFAMYNTLDHFIGGGSLMAPYIARHYPWEMTLDEAKNNIEFSYYLDRVNGSCSYKTFLSIPKYD
jgi:hypothetical protein